MSGLLPAAIPRPIDPTAALCVEASAGTGKTKVLIDRVLSLLLAGAEPRRLLCLTFTKAAAAEMANRLAQRLGRWTALDDPALDRELAELGRDRPDDAQRRHARSLFAAVLDTPGGMRIETIHAFCQSLLRRFPIEAGIAPHFEVLDDRAAAELLAEAERGLLMGTRGADQDGLAAALGLVAGYVDEERFLGLVDRLARARGRLLPLLAPTGGLEAAIGASWDAVGLALGTTTGDLLAAACQEEAFDGPGLRRAVMALLGGKVTDQKRGQAMADWLAAPLQREEGFDAYAGCFIKKEGGIVQRLITKDPLKGAPGADLVLAEEARRVLAVQERCRAVETATRTEALLKVGAALLARYAALKEGRAAADYDDLILTVRALMERPGVAPWVLYKLDGGIDHILIDEAQDTNPDQWQVVAALAEEFFAGEGARPRTRTLFAVGDVKQSIYSFQGADPQVFGAMRDFLAARLPADRAKPVVELTRSYRSVPAVLHAVDRVFASGPARDGVVATGATLHHQTSREGEGGLVELWPLVEPRLLDQPEPWQPPDRRVESDSPPARIARHIARRIGSWLSEGEILASQGRPIRASDVLILVRRREPLVEALIRALKREGIGVAGADRMVLTEQLAVMDLLALCRFLLLPEDDLTLATVLKGPLIGLDEDQLFRLAARPGRRTLWAELTQAAANDEAFAGARDELAALLAAADHVPPFELLSQILTTRGGRQKLVARLGPEAEDPIEELLAAALAFESAHPPELEAFLRWLETSRTQIKRDHEVGVRDEVRVMTVHGAKGLQAPIVFLPDTTQVPRLGEALLWAETTSASGRPALLWSPKAEGDDPASAAARALAEAARDREYRRLLYVAMTRAQDRLYVCGYRQQREPPEDCWYGLIAAGLEEVGEVVVFGPTDAAPEGRGRRLETPQRQTPRAEPGLGPTAAQPPLPGWARRSAPAETPTPRRLVPSQEAGEPPLASPLGSDNGQRFRRGELIHRLLQTLPELARASWPGACQRFLARAGRDLDPASAAEIARTVLAVLDHPDFAPLFGPGSAAEVPLGGRIGALVITGQIDRLVVDDQRVLILDYKTHRTPPQRPEDVPAPYLRQMAAYRAALAPIYPGRRIDCVLAWTEEPRLMALPAALLDAHLPSGLGTDAAGEAPGPRPQS